MGNWYGINILCYDKKIAIWDALKKFPGLSLQQVAGLFGIEGKKEKPFFDAYRPIDYKPTDEEIEYCLQDSRILAYAMKKEYEAGHTGMTLSSDAFNDVKNTIGGYKGWRKNMPELLDSVDAFVRKAYKGGWVYCNPKYQNKELENVTVYDVNSLYPWVMHDCPLPVGPAYVGHKPHGRMLSVMKFKAEFKLETGFPTIQIKNTPRYKDTEYLKRSEGPTELCLTNVDYELFKDNYSISYMSEPEYVSFYSQVGLLAPYIDKWMEVKKQATIEKKADLRFISKRYLNSPYGKTGMRGDRVNKVPIRNTTGAIGYKPNMEQISPIYIPYATFVCAWARDKTIRAAQAEYDNFIYADTDSIHLVGDHHSNIDIDPVRLGAWKHEGTFEIAKYLRPKTYIHGKLLEGEKIVTDITCAGMPDNVKQTVAWDDFRIGAEFFGKTLQRQVPGGVLIEKTTFKIKEEGMNG